jgi:IS5 family transposase
VQTSFSELEYSLKKKQTRRDRFLAEIEAVTPWVALEKAIVPFYPSSGGRGRPPIGLTRMLRMYVAQQCFGLSDEGIEDALYDSQAIRHFVGIDLSRESAPDATTLLNFRHLLERHQLTASIFNTINAHLAEKGLLLREGTIIDATLIAAPPSTKNKDGQRDPEMHQSKKGKQWYFGMKAHIGVDAQSGLVYTVIGTAGNVSDITQAQALLHGDETDIFGDAGYQGVEKREENLEVPVTHRGKPPAMPGDSPRFDLYDGLREFLISAKRKEIHNERVPEPESYEMGLQISRGIHTEAAEEARLRSAAPTSGRDVSRIGRAQGSEDCRRAPDGRPRAHLHQHSAEVRCVECGRVPQGEKRDPDSTEVRSTAEELHRRALLGQRVLRLHGRTGREHGASVHPESGRRRRAVRSNEARNGVSRHRRLTVSWAPLRRSQSQATGFAGGV